MESSERLLVIPKSKLVQSPYGYLHIGLPTWKWTSFKIGHIIYRSSETLENKLFFYITQIFCTFTTHCHHFISAILILKSASYALCEIVLSSSSMDTLSERNSVLKTRLIVFLMQWQSTFDIQLGSNAI